jgi:hypothetical protein
MGGRTDDSPLHWRCILCVADTLGDSPAAHPAGNWSGSCVDHRLVVED